MIPRAQTTLLLRAAMRALVTTCRTGVACLILAAPVHAADITWEDSWDTGFAAGGLIDDGSPAGWSDTRRLAGAGFDFITSVKVSITISGGYNGDYYAYLQHGSGFSILLNRVGVTAGEAFGYGDSGLNITLSDSAANGDIHLYQNVAGFESLIVSGALFQPDGRPANPLTVTDATPRTATLGTFGGDDPNGDWTLFVADLSTGEQGVVSRWGLEINGTIAAVPEPGTWALLGLGLALLGGARVRRRQRR